MDGRRFDAAARGLARAATRRGVLAGALGIVIAQVPAPALEARRRPQKSRRGERAADDALDIPGGQVGGIWEETIEICLYDAETGEVAVVPVPLPALPDYLNAGHDLYIDCCVDAECQPRVCATPAGCIEGACMYDTTGGAPCLLGDGTTGVCDKSGTCLPGVPVAPVATSVEPVAPAA
jgi:hypothetical protein